MTLCQGNKYDSTSLLSAANLLSFSLRPPRISALGKNDISRVYGKLKLETH